MGKAMIHDLGGSRSFGRLSLKAKVLWPMLLGACDDQGRGGAAPDEVTWYICPNVDEIAKEDIPRLFAELEEQGMVHIYEDDDGEPLFQIIKWWKYQKPQWAQPSKYPAPNGWIDRIRYNVRGKDYVEENWDHPGGFAEQEPGDEQGENPSGNPPGKQGGLPIKSSSSIDRNREDSSSLDPDRNPFRLYEKAKGTLSPLIADELNDLIDEMEGHRYTLPPPAKGSGIPGVEWVSRAIEEAAKSTDRFNLKYVTAILDRWKRDGLEAPRKDKKDPDEPVVPKATRVYT